MRIVADYDGASIDVVSISGDILTLALKADPPCELEGGKQFAQHFCFTVSGAAGRDLEIRIGNAGSAMCSEAYNGCAPSLYGYRYFGATSSGYAAATSASAPTEARTERFFPPPATRLTTARAGSVRPRHSTARR
jgi:hypothetical protein